LLDACVSILDGRSECVSVKGHVSAAEWVPRVGIDVVVLSESREDEDGHRTLRALKQLFPQLPVILASEALASDQIIAALRSGADALLRKPVDPPELFASICRLSRSQAESDKLRFRLFSLRPAPLPSPGVSQPCRDGTDGGKRSPVMNGLLEIGAAGLRQLARRFKECSSSRGPHAPTHNLEAYYFGTFRVLVNGVPLIAWQCRKWKSLLAFLLLHHRRPACRDLLMERFWPGVPSECARNSLNVAVHGIRHELHILDPAHDFILFRDECYCLNPAVALWLDVEQFQTHWQRGRICERNRNMHEAARELTQALDLYRGDFMEEDLYDDWPSLERENLRETYLQVLDRLSEHYLQDGKPTLAAEMCERILEKDNCREDVHRRLMLSYALLGHRDRALRHFRKCCDILRSELDVAPTAATTRLVEEIRKGAPRIRPSRQVSDLLESQPWNSR
jgi:DNA-binding SARP family transcriptional activator